MSLIHQFAMSNETIHQLEQYSLEHPQEVLVVHADIDGQPDEVVIFRGFSSSLMRPTAFDLDIPILPNHAEIQFIDRLKGPLNPQSPQPIETQISWAEFQNRLG